ncbi:NitT/TauT family transport system ATP-binding protein [Azospirillum baldaniorum]|uniref:ABC transporter ATP-binding protein n=1 Tax=Azospirillum argentinense TaxID=2970906 RepID=A0ABW8VHZ3_9PROT|nr:ABC transporter ATP-binding protein [Azospirillum baldaniorum]TWA57382.1 NitT/TauT family transport system ATP-binding protein [Azospirillum baldaniorum]
MDGPGVIAPPHAKIRVEGVVKTYAADRAVARTTALQDVSLHLGEGELVCLLGPSGCGKSTVLNLIAGFERPEFGAVTVDGRPVERPGPDRAVVFQQPQLFPWLNVLDNVTFGPRMAGVPAARYREDAARYLRLVGLTGFERHAPYELSGGMRQRVALARAWIANPAVLLMDEPFAALDAQTRLTMQELLLDLRRATGTTILFVTHDIDEALFLADRVLVMTARPGRIKAEVAVPRAAVRDFDSLFDDPAMAQRRHDLVALVREEARKAAPQPHPETP